MFPGERTVHGQPVLESIKRLGDAQAIYPIRSLVFLVECHLLETRTIVDNPFV